MPNIRIKTTAVKWLVLCLIGYVICALIFSTIGNRSHQEHIKQPSIDGDGGFRTEINRHKAPYAVNKKLLKADNSPICNKFHQIMLYSHSVWYNRHRKYQNWNNLLPSKVFGQWQAFYKSAGVRRFREADQLPDWLQQDDHYYDIISWDRVGIYSKCAAYKHGSLQFDPNHNLSSWAVCPPQIRDDELDTYLLDCDDNDPACAANDPAKRARIIVLEGCTDKLLTGRVRGELGKHMGVMHAFASVYAYYDCIAHSAQRLMRKVASRPSSPHYPAPVIAWAMPKVVSQSDSVHAELLLLHQYLALSHLVRRCGLLVLAPYSLDLYTQSMNPQQPFIPSYAKVVSKIGAQLRLVYSGVAAATVRATPSAVRAAKSREEGRRLLSFQFCAEKVTGSGGVIENIGGTLPSLNQLNSTSALLLVISNYQKQLLLGSASTTKSKAPGSRDTALGNYSYVRLSSVGHSSQGLTQRMPGAGALLSLRSRCQLLALTRKYDPVCHPPSALTHPLLVTGLGGSGSHYVANALRERGWRVRHEDIDSDGAVVSE